MSHRISTLIATAAAGTILMSGAWTGAAIAAPSGGPTDLASSAQTPPTGPGGIAAPTPTDLPQGPSDIAAPAPAPSAPGGIADAPAVASGATLTDFTVKPIKAFSFTYHWKSNRKTSLFQSSTQQLVKTDGVYSFGKSVKSVTVTGTRIGKGKPGQLAGGAPTYKFSHTVTGTQPQTKYFVLVSVPLSSGFLPVQRAWSTTTEAAPALPPAKRQTRIVTAKVTQIKVIKDGDTGIRGKGEVSFGVRLAPDADKTIPSAWGDFSHGPDGYFKAKDGQTIKLSNSLDHEITTTANKALVEVQGFENDVDVHENFCPQGSFADAPAREDSDNCYDAAVARVLVDLPGGNKSSKQTVTAKVPGSPALSFEATVVVTSAVA